MDTNLRQILPQEFFMLKGRRFGVHEQLLLIVTILISFALITTS